MILFNLNKPVSGNKIVRNTPNTVNSSNIALKSPLQSDSFVSFSSNSFSQNNLEMRNELKRLDKLRLERVNDFKWGTHPIAPERVLQFNNKFDQMKTSINDLFLNDQVSIQDKRSSLTKDINEVMEILSHVPQEIGLDLKVTPNGLEIDKAYGGISSVLPTDMARLVKSVDLGIHCHTYNSPISSGDIGYNASLGAKMVAVSAPDYNYYFWNKDGSALSGANDMQWFLYESRDKESKLVDSLRHSSGESDCDNVRKELTENLVDLSERYGFNFIATDKSGNIAYTSSKDRYPEGSKFDFPMELIVPDDYNPVKAPEIKIDKTIVVPENLKAIGEKFSIGKHEFTVLKNTTVVNNDGKTVIRQLIEEKDLDGSLLALYDGEKMPIYTCCDAEDSILKFYDIYFKEKPNKITDQPYVFLKELVEYAKEKNLKQVHLDINRDLHKEANENIDTSKLRKIGFEPSPYGYDKWDYNI